MRQVRIDRIVQAAAKVFEARGLEAASVRQIAQTAGCTTGAIYPLFSSKDEIYAELLQRSLSELKDEMEQAADGLSEPQDRLLARSKTMCTFYLQRPFHFGLSFYVTGGLKRKGLGTALNQRLNAQLSVIAQLQQSDLADVVGEARAASEVSSLFAHITGVLMLKLRGRLDVLEGDPERMIEQYLNQIIGAHS